MDALAQEGEEGRSKLRKASGSRKQAFNPRISEWGNPAWDTASSVAEFMGHGSQRGEVNHLSTLRKRKQSAIPSVAASEQGTAQTEGVQAQERCVVGVVGRALDRLNGPGSQKTVG